MKEVIELARQNLPPHAIARHLKLTAREVRAVLEKAGITPTPVPKYPLTGEQVERITRLAGTKSPLEIAPLVNLPVPTVRRVIRKAGITPPRKSYEWKEKPDRSRPAPWKRKAGTVEPPKRQHPVGSEKPFDVTAEDRKYPAPTARPNPTQEARHAFGNRLTERDGSYHLDGKPVGFNDLMRRVNRCRADWGMAQLDANPAWVGSDSI